MNLLFQKELKIKLPKLRDLCEVVKGDREAPDQLWHQGTFIYDGYVYVVIKKTGMGISLTTAKDKIACLNLKSHSVRALSPDIDIQPVRVDAKVYAPKTRRYK